MLQVELLDAALQRNTIVCLGTSGGNTFISVMLLKEFSTELRKQLQCGGKRSVVCLNSGTIQFKKEKLFNFPMYCISSCLIFGYEC